MKKIFLIRHAESYSNIGEIHLHTNNVKITEIGIKQSHLLTKKLEKPDKIIFSKYLRTIKTAEPMMKKHPDSEFNLWLDIHEFDYLNKNKKINTDFETYRNHAKDYWLKCDPYYYDDKEKENFKDFVDRVNKVILKIKKLKGVNIIFSMVCL